VAVLSIQSHVVFGYAGNTAAVFPLQRLGREVWAINTVEFSNHTGYGAWRGKVLGADMVSQLVTGLEERSVLSRCEAVLSGYLGDADVGRAIVDTVRRVRRESPKAIYFCDPVMGDIGPGLYVKPDIPDIFKNELIPIADIISPNQFELEHLTGINTGTIENAARAVNTLHNRGPSVVLVTSYRDNTTDRKETGKSISMLASDKSGLYRVSTPELPMGQGAGGTGDLTAAVFLSRYLETGDLKKTLELTAASIYGILEASLPLRKEANLPVENSHLELLIINAQQELISPTHYFEAVKLNK
jgi:pyridoxine kinase